MTTETKSNHHPDRVLRTDEARLKLGVGKTTFYELNKRADFPRAIVLGERARGYSEIELEAWIEAQKQSRC